MIAKGTATIFTPTCWLSRAVQLSVPTLGVLSSELLCGGAANSTPLMSAHFCRGEPMGRFEFLCIGVPSATTPPKANGAQFRSEELLHWLDADLKDSESCC